MVDMIDRASEREIEYTADAVSNALRKTPPLPACGQCYNCLASLPDGVKFCDSECRNDYDMRKRSEALR